MTATKVNVAFHTIPVTSVTSDNETTPVSIATAAPISAVIPISSPFGYQMTNVNVARKIITASSVMMNILLLKYDHRYRGTDYVLTGLKEEMCHLIFDDSMCRWFLYLPFYPSQFPLQQVPSCGG